MINYWIVMQAKVIYKISYINVLSITIDNGYNEDWKLQTVHNETIGKLWRLKAEILATCLDESWTSHFGLRLAIYFTRNTKELTIRTHDLLIGTNQNLLIGTNQNFILQGSLPR